MQDDLQEQTRSRAAAQTRRRKRRIWVAGLCCAVAAATAYALTRPALTMTQQTFCGQEAHTHDESCYETILICGQDEQLPVEQPTPHVHTEGCYAASLVLVCGQEESEEHTHTEDCCQTQYELICPLEEGEAEDEPEIPAHVHTDACYETRLICEKPEHTHSLSCYADAQADLESASVWEQTIPQTLSGQWRADVVAVAESQLGYAASTRNYIVDEAGGMHGYTRYGAWYGSPYGEWCAMFASFCLHYAGVPEDSIPAQAGCIRWTEQLQALGRYAAAGAAAPQPGDLVFFDTGSDGYADHVALVAEVSADGASLTTIEGNVGGCVVRKQHALDEAGLLGFGILPEQEDNGETPEEPAEPETPARTPLCGHEEHSHTADCYDETGTLICALEEHTHTDACYEPAAEKTPLCGHEAHTHTADCYDETGTLICALEEHTHTDACYEPAAEKTPLCGLEEHTHTEDCYSADGTLVCELPEHTHTDACYEAASTQRFSYADAQLQLTLTVESAQPLPEGTELDVQTADAAVFSGLSDGEASDGAEQWIVRQLALVQSDEALDTAAYRMTAEIAVTDAVLQPLLGQLDALDEAAPEAETGVTLAVMQAGDEGLQELDSATISAEEAAPVFTVSVQSGTIAVLATTANPHYTVQYYAYIPRFAESGGEKALTVFDTSGGQLPRNDTTKNPTRQLQLEAAGDMTSKNNGTQTSLYRVKTETVLTQMYTPNAFEYIKAPNPSYIDKLNDNLSYKLKAVWVLKDGKSADSLDESDWDVYGTDIHFTNRDTGSSDVICIKDNTVIRLIYDCRDATQTLPATFYDYDITSNGTLSGTTGINQESNYGISRNSKTTWRSYRDVLAFGNANCGTGMANYAYAGAYLNKHSGKNYGCAFGLVDSLDKNGYIVYNEWVVAPKLFNDGSAEGKHTYDGSSLTFSQVGDTYTLSSASVSGGGSVDQLDRFFNPATGTTVYEKIFTNDFWPLDAATNKTDPLFGNKDSSVSYRGFKSVDNISGTWDDESGTFPTSDDGRAHNSFFGMQYAVTFTLTEDYVGPLEYYFFGDDDMWVFLDGKLICDIGGVHSSVGEYVNLWDYIDADRTEDEQHTLTFFYTERGASGSTCYMNFTLPSVSGVNIEQKTGDLKVLKQVVGAQDVEEKDFTFKIRFYDQNGNTVIDDYSYSKTTDGGTVDDLILHEGSTFTLKDGESITIKYLPIGLRYTITELSTGGYSVTNTVNGSISPGADAVGTVIKDALNQVVFTNTLDSVGLVMQKLDPEGNPLSGAQFRLKNSAGTVMNFVQNAQGVYTVPSGSAEELRFSTTLPPDGAAYYLAAAEKPDYVLTQDASDPYRAQLQKKDGSAAQKLYIYKQPDGSYSFRSALNGKWLDLDKNGLANGTMIHFWDNSSTPPDSETQKWYLMVNDDGSFKIKPRKAVLEKNTAVMDINGAAFSAGTVIQAWEDNDSNAQKWLLVPVDTAAAPETVQALVCDETAVLRISGLLPGTYTLNEIQAPEGYQNTLGDVQLYVKADGSVELIKPNGLVSTEGSGSSMIIKLTNRPSDRTLTLKKEVIHGDTGKAFPFTVTYLDEDGNEVKAASPKLKDGEISEPITIPYGALVTIREEKHEGYALAFTIGSTLLESDGSSYTFTMKDAVTITAVNTAGYALPVTGGGVVWIWAAGLSLLLAAGLVSILRLRRRCERGTR